MALAILRLDDSDDSTLTFAVDTGTSSHYCIHIGTEVRRDEGIVLLDAPYWSSPLQVNAKAGRHFDTRTTYAVPAHVVTERGSLAQLESCRGADGRGPAFSRPVRLPVAVPVVGPAVGSAAGTAVESVIGALGDDGIRPLDPDEERARRRVLTMSRPSSPASLLPARAAVASSGARARMVPITSAQATFSRQASIGDLIGSVVQAAAPVVLGVLAKALPASGGATGSATGAAAGGQQGAGEATASLLADVLRTVLSALASPSAAKAPPAQATQTTQVQASQPQAGSTRALPAASALAAAPALAKSHPTEDRRNRFVPYASPLIFGIDDALIAAVAGPVISGITGPLVEALPQLLNAASAQKLDRQKQTDKQVMDLLTEVNRSMLLQQLISAQNQPVNPGVASSDLAAIGSLLQQIAPAPAPTGTPAAGAALATTASVTRPDADPIASRAVLAPVTGPPVTILGAPRTAFVQDRAPTLRFRLEVGATGPAVALPRAILTLCVREPGGATDLCRRVEQLTSVTPGAELKVMLTEAEAQALPLDTELEVLASLRWKGVKGTYQATSCQKILRVSRVQVCDRGEAVGQPLELTDMNRFRTFWNKVWESPLGQGPDVGALPMWGLDVALRYSVVPVAGVQSNGLMAARVQEQPAEVSGLRVTTRGRLKSGLEVSVAELARLVTLWPGEQPVAEADLTAFTARGWLAGQGGDAVTSVRLEGKRGTRGALWVVPVMRLRSFTLATASEIDPYGQLVGTTDRVVRFPVVESIRVLGLSSLRQDADPGEAATVDGAVDASGAPAAYRFDGYDVASSALVGLEPALPIPRTQG